MTNEEMIIEVKKRIGELGDAQDDVIGSYLLSAKNVVLSRLYPFDLEKEDIPTRYDTKVIEIAVYLFDKEGAEGQLSHSENGVNRSYASADVPEDMLRGITPFAGVI
ncbi:MAG: phage head-tail connector protein [Clostridia bacterium]|nr:phage head-tail connector protein [Clostridia bacterium]